MKIGNMEVYGIIYEITNIVNGKVYIGQTTTGFDRRYCYSGKGIERVYNYYLNNYKDNIHLSSSLKKYGIENFEVNETLDIACSKEELDIKEDIYINLYNSIKNGYNNQTGGANGRPSKETKIKMSKSKKGVESPLKGRHLSEYTKKKLSDTQINSDNYEFKSILQFDTDGNLIKKWERGANQIKRESEFDDHPIRNCCKGDRISAYGFIWLYECEYDKALLENKINNKHEREIIQRDLNGEIIKIYKNIKEVELYTKISKPTIGSMLKGNKSRKYINFTFEYKQIKLVQ